MKIYWSPAAQGFFDSRVNPIIPKDAVEISASHRDELMEGRMRNQVIVCRANGFPVLVDAPPASARELADAERQWRNAQLAETDPVITRHRDQVEAQVPTTLTAEHYGALQTYRHNLRCWPASEQFPNAADRPAFSVTESPMVKKPRAKTKTKA